MDISKLLAKAIESAIEEEFDQRVKALAEDLNTRKREIVAALALQVFSRLSIRDLGNIIEIQIKDIKLQ